MRALKLALLGTVALVASTAATVSAQPPVTGQAQGQRVGGHRGMHRGGHGQRMLFRGITLNDAQKSQLKAVRERYRTQFQSMRNDARTQWGGRPANGAPVDTAARRSQREAFRGRMHDLRQRQIADVRNILTPTQQGAFDKNVSELRARDGQRGAHGHRGMRSRRGGVAPNGTV